MPNFERDSFYGSYDKILAIFNSNNDDSSTYSRNNRVSVSLQTNISYEESLSTMTNDTYNKAAGSDISAIFYPYSTIRGSEDLPSFHSDAGESGKTPESTSPTNVDVLPFQWDPKESGYIYSRWSAPSGDAIPNLLSGEEYFGDTNQFRDISNTRGVGLRLPLIGVGWGYTTDGEPWPSGERPASSNDPSGTKYFKGGHLNGWNMDPTDYVAAPIDIRYDKTRHVWTTVSQDGFWARLVASSGYRYNPSAANTTQNDGGPNPPGVQLYSPTGTPSGLVYSWQEVEALPSGHFRHRTGLRTGQYNAYEPNVFTPATNLIVWMRKAPNKDYYFFERPLPKSNNRYKVLQIIDDMGQINWDYPRFFSLPF